MSDRESLFLARFEFFVAMLCAVALAWLGGWFWLIVAPLSFVAGWRFTAKTYPRSLR